MVVAEAYGSETDLWNGRPVQLRVEKVTFQGRLVDAIRLRLPASAPVGERGEEFAPF